MMEADDPCTERLDEIGLWFDLIGCFGFAVFSGAVPSSFHFFSFTFNGFDSSGSRAFRSVSLLPM